MNHSHHSVMSKIGIFFYPIIIIFLLAIVDFLFKIAFVFSVAKMVWFLDESNFGKIIYVLGGGGFSVLFMGMLIWICMVFVSFVGDYFIGEATKKPAKIILILLGLSNAVWMLLFVSKSWNQFFGWHFISVVCYLFVIICILVPYFGAYRFKYVKEE